MTDSDKKNHLSFCPDGKRLLEEFGQAVKELVALHESQFLSIVNEEPDSNRFDLLIHMASEKKREAKYVYMRHVEEHGC